MKAYVYSPAEAGLDSWHSGELRLEGFDVTTDPAQADVFVCPGNLSMFQHSGVIDRERIYRLPYLKGNEAKHCFFDVSDNFTKAIGFPFLFIRCDVRDWMLKDDPNTIQIAWPVEDYAECVAVQEGGFKFDISFQGWLSTQARIASSEACRDYPGLKADIACYSDFTGYIYYEAEGIRRRAEFRRSMRESRLALCPESIPGVLPYRFFEAMSAGRVPLLVSSDYVLPFADEIPYAEFMFQLPSADAHYAGRAAREFVRSHSDDEIIEMGRKARGYWKAWLNRDDWPRTMGYAVEKQVNK